MDFRMKIDESFVKNVIENGGWGKLGIKPVLTEETAEVVEEETAEHVCPLCESSLEEALSDESILEHLYAIEQLINELNEEELDEWKAGRVARQYGKGRMKPDGDGSGGDGSGGDDSDGNARKMDPLVSREAETTQANVDRKLGFPTNLRKQDAVQGSMNRRREAERKKAKERADRKAGGGSGGNLTPADREALSHDDINKRAGDR